MPEVNRRDLLKSGLAGLGAAALSPASAALQPAGHAFHHDHVIGTSLDLLVTADEEAAAAAERVVLAEVERLRRVFSTFDSDSEVSRLNRSTGPVPASAELIEVLRLYERWQWRAGGAFNGRVGELARVWEYAARAGRGPDPATLGRIVAELREPGWVIDESARSVTRLADQPLNLNSVAKGYIIRSAAAAVRERVPGVRGLLLNLGGDITTWGVTEAGSAEWPVAVQDPFRPQDNAPPLGALSLSDAAVATSGGYQRFYDVAGSRHSHVLDPRTGRPASGVASATVVAPESVTANALATTLCVLTPDEGLRLVASVPGAECLVVAADGRVFTSPGLRLRPVTRVAADDKKDEEPTGDPWPEGYRVTVAVEIPKIDVNRYRRPYVAVWVESDGKAVRTLSVWGNAPKYLKDLTDWWKVGKDDQALVKAVTRATRGPGKYELVWDGKDDKGNPLGQGTYTVRVEVHREFGKHLRQTGKIDCKAEDAAVTLEKNDETGDTVVTYAKKK